LSRDRAVRSDRSLWPEACAAFLILADWSTTVIAFIIIFGTMFAVFVAGIVVGVPEQ
jgi:hypothetical protein